MKNLQFVFIAGLFCTTSFAFLTIDRFQDEIESKCYDFKGGKELINGQISPLPSSLETFVSIVERLEEQRYSREKILRGLIGRFHYDDLLYKIAPITEEGSFATRGGQDVKRVHQILENIFGGSMNDEFRDTDLSEDERCALYFMISHTVNDTVLPHNQQETIAWSGSGTVLKYPREQGVVNLNTRTRHAFALGKVLLGILVGLQGAEQTVSAESLFRKFNPTRDVPKFLNGNEINILHSVTISDVLALTLRYKNNIIGTSDQLFLPNGFWDDSVCPTKYILDENTNTYATKALIRGAVDGLMLGKKMKELKDAYSDIQLSQILRIYYSSAMATSDNSLTEISWCNRHSFFSSSYQTEIIQQAALYYKLYVATLDEVVTNPEMAMTDIVSQISSQASTIFDEIYNEDEDGCRTVSSGSKTCETPAEISAVLDYKASDVLKEMQYQIIGNLSVGLNMGPGRSSMTVYSNLRPAGGGYKLHTINSTSISGCASCAAKYYGFFDVVPTSTENEIEVFRDLNRTLTPDDLQNPDENEAGVPSKVVLYFNYLNPTDNQELRNAVWNFRSLHRGTRVFAIGSKKEALRPFVESVDYDIFDKNDARSIVTSLKERVCKVPAQFQYQNCYTNSRSDEATNVYHGFITPYHMQYWAMYPKYFLKSFKIEMSFTTLGGQIKVCFTRNYDEIYGNRPANPNCQVAEGEKAAKFYESNPCKKYNVNNCRPFYFTVEAMNVPERRCAGTQDKRCRTPNQIEFEFKHNGISCNRGFSFAATPMTLVVALFVSIFFAFKH